MSPRRALAASAALLVAAGACQDGPSSAPLTAVVSRLRRLRPAPAPAPRPPGDTLDFVVRTARRHPISRFIYGLNFAGERSAWANADTPAEVTFSRMGGNRLSAYNWETNYSNAGSDYRYQNDQLLSTSTVPGEAVRARAAPTFARGAAFLATVPMLPYVAGDACNCDVGATDAGLAARLAAHFKQNVAARGGPPAAAPDVGDRAVYQDEFVAWAARTFPGATGHPTRRLMFSLDNEPDLWHGTHKEVQSDFGDDPRTPRLQTYDAFIDTSVEFARAIKRVAPDATVFGPAVATYTGVVTLGRHPKPDPTYGDWRVTPFVEVYLDRMREAERREGRRLLDVLDLHWYPAASGGSEITNDRTPQDSATIEARLQAPRSLWDPAYDERSWVSEVTAGPVRLLPRLREQIAAHYPGTGIAITEYYYGRGGDISGGVAQADVLGVFGREGVFAAAVWPHAAADAEPYNGDGRRAYAYLFGAFRMYLNYDGAGGRFGDVGVEATTNDAVSSSAYASVDSAGRVVVVAINKARAPRAVRLRVEHPAALRAARAYTLVDGRPAPARAADPAVGPGNVLRYTMPALSVSTLVLAP